MHKTFTVLIALAIVLAASSGAYAAKGLLTGADVKSGSLTGANIAPHSLGAELFTASAKASMTGDDGLRGLKGSAGAPGSPGLTGRTGATGPAGTVGSGGAAGAAGAVGAVGPVGATGGAGTAGAPGSVGLAGATGPIGLTGAAGSNGTSGTNGTNGANGTVTPLFASAGLTALVTAAAPVIVVALTVPAGTYVVLAKSQVAQTGAGDSIDCSLKSGATTIDQISLKTLPALAAAPVALQAVTTVASATQLSVQCAVEVANGTASFSSLIAIPTS